MSLHASDILAAAADAAKGRAALQPAYHLHTHCQWLSRHKRSLDFNLKIPHGYRGFLNFCRIVITQYKPEKTAFLCRFFA